MSAYLSPIGNEQQSDSNGAPVSGALINTYVAGTSTPVTTYSDAAGVTPQQNPIACNAAGYPANPIYLPAGVAVKMVFTTSVASGASAYRPAVDNIQGVNDPAFSATVSEWQAFSGTPTYINATSFSLAGDQTLTFQVLRRIRTTNTGGTVYSSISNSAFAAGITTVTVTNDSTSLDSGLSAVSVGLLSATNPSIPEGVTGKALRLTATALAARAALEVEPAILPITASVAGNALTITLNPCLINFRSTTLGSGTTTAVTVAAAISVVVPNTATLGTVNATLSRLVPIVINNAGTAELAVINIAGGTSLDESGLISTTTIAAASNSATTAYSTTGRNNVAYRVGGVIESTQATAGTWATAPSLVQGKGGQAMAAMQSLGFGQTWQIVTGSRAVSTTYYNTTGKPIQVMVTATLTVAGNGLVLTVGGVAVWGNLVPAVNTTSYISVVVPPGASYALTVTGGAIGSLDRWQELR